MDNLTVIVLLVVGFLALLVVVGGYVFQSRRRARTEWPGPTAEYVRILPTTARPERPGESPTGKEWVPEEAAAPCPEEAAPAGEELGEAMPPPPMFTPPAPQPRYEMERLRGGGGRGSRGGGPAPSYSPPMFMPPAPQPRREMARPPAPPPPPPPPPRTVTRYPDVSLRDKVPMNQRCTLRVAVTLAPAKEEMKEYGMTIAMPVAAPSVTVDVLVTAQDFEIVGDEYRPLVVPADKDSEPLIFQMIPRSTGEKKVKVEFFQEARYIGGVTATTTVVATADVMDATEVRAQGTMGMDQDASPPDLTVLITEGRPDGDKMRYTFRLHSPANGLFFYPVGEELGFTGSPSQWMEGLYKELGHLTANTSPEDLAETLSTIGSDLYEKLFPRELKELWQKRIRGKVKSVMIISDEPWIPWEIIKPAHETETGEIVEDDFLCRDYLLTRWIAGPPAPSHLEVSRGALIAPLVAELPDAQQEVDFLTTRLPGMSAISPSLAGVRALLKSGGVQLIHLACHGSFDPQEHENSVVYLQGNEALMSRDISGERRNFGKDKPFVFLNACQTGRADLALVGIGSWADKFIHANCSGFLGASWEVDDALAYKFSTCFYIALLEGKTLGQAVHQARLAISQEADPTWLAYTLYADPLARVVFV